MHLIEQNLCQKVASVLEECNKQHNKDSLQLVYTWLDSEVFERIIDGDVALCSQAKSYIIRTFMYENKDKLDIVQTNTVFCDEALFWFGYLVTYWCLEYQETGINILKNYDVQSILYSYEVLHSLSIKSSIEKIKEDYFRG